MTVRLIVSPLSQLDATWRMHQPSYVIGLLSPTSVHPVLDGHAAAQRLILEFHDINVAQEGLTAPDLAMVSSLIEFAQKWDGDAPLLIHCWAGISRSTAAAFIAACTRAPHVAEGDIADRLMVELADGLLGRDGRMVEAVDRIGRGDDAAEGVVFELRV
jgi:predicted protein tyrosine phosphatase